ncbi:hypothetical protein Tco_0886127 [Tanacetum coccineum]
MQDSDILWREISEEVCVVICHGIKLGLCSERGSSARKDASNDVPENSIAEYKWSRGKQHHYGIALALEKEGITLFHLLETEFQNNEDGYNLTRVDYKKSVEQGVEIETGSNHVGDGFDSSRDNVEPLGTTLKCETPNEVVQDGSEEEPSYAAGNFPEKDGSVDAGEASPFPAHSHEKDNLNFELGYGSDSYVEKKGHLTDNGSRYGKGDGDLSQSEVGDVDLSPSYGGEKVGLIIPSPSTDVKERCISYCHGLDHVEISDGLNSGTARAEGNAIGNNGNQRCYNCRILLGTTQSDQEKEMPPFFRLSNLKEIEEVNANCILMANLKQVSTSGTQTDKAPVYDSHGSAKIVSTASVSDLGDVFEEEKDEDYESF